MRCEYMDFYGCKAVITTFPWGSANLQIWTDKGVKFLDKGYKNFAGARSALGKYTEGTAKLTDTKAYTKNMTRK